MLDHVINCSATPHISIVRYIAANNRDGIRDISSYNYYYIYKRANGGLIF